MAAEPTGFHWHHPAIEACMNGEADGLILPVVADERPLGGLARVVDLRFFGAISQFRDSMISGAEGDCVWIPLFLPPHVKSSIVLKNNVTPSLYIFGLGNAEERALKSKRPVPSTASMKLLTKNIKTAGEKIWAVSRQDFGDAPESFFHQHFPKTLIKIFP